MGCLQPRTHSTLLRWDSSGFVINSVVTADCEPLLPTDARVGARLAPTDAMLRETAGRGLNGWLCGASRCRNTVAVPTLGARLAAVSGGGRDGRWSAASWRWRCESCCNGIL